MRERFLGDAVYFVPALLTSQAHVRAGDDAFVYRFDWTHLARTPAWSLRMASTSFVRDVGDAERFPPSAAIARHRTSALP